MDIFCTGDFFVASWQQLFLLKVCFVFFFCSGCLSCCSVILLTDLLLCERTFEVYHSTSLLLTVTKGNKVNPTYMHAPCKVHRRTIGRTESDAIRYPTEVQPQASSFSSLPHQVDQHWYFWCSFSAPPTVFIYAAFRAVY